MIDPKVYLERVAQTPKESYRSILQATMDSEWENTTRIRTIKEQRGLPFVDEYDEIEVYLDNISDDMINTSKVYSDFVRIIFKDIDHKQNHKGQMYKIAVDDEANEEYYICYDRINRIAEIAETKAVRCNNVLTWRDEYGKIITMPCYLGTDISSTNNQISKQATIPNARMIVLVQANEFTKTIHPNQRFMFQHKTCFKVEEVNDYMWEQGTDGEVTCVKIYINYSTILPTDNKELNICEYYKNNYTVEINQETINQISGFSGKFESIVKDSQDNIVDMPLKWSTSDSDVIIIDEQGNYSIVGENGNMAKIRCSMADNEDSFDEVEINVVDYQIMNRYISVNPKEDTIIKQGKFKDFMCGVYSEGDKHDDAIITCIGSGVKDDCYTITEIDGGFRVACNKYCEELLNITFSSLDCEDVVISIELMGRV